VSEPATQAEELEALVGTTLAERYRIDELLGVGGMGAVFRARHLLLKRDVAVKVLHPELGANPDVSKRFDREAQSAARLDHPNIIPVTEFGSTDDGMKYMVMQLLSGKELGELMGRPLDPLRAIDLEIQILRGLEHAHNNGVVHRDLKPENVFVTTDHDDEEILKLVDFGIAKIIDEDEEDDSQPLTRMGLVFGTPHYMSPEQATGSLVDHRTDIYSAGILLYQMLAGRLPFDHEDPVSLIRMQVSVDPPPLPKTVPIPLQRVVKMMMAKSRDQRYPDARSARKALQAVQARLAEDAGVPVKFSAFDTGVVDPRDIYPEGHEAIAGNPAFGSDSSPAWDPSEVSGPGFDGVAPTIPPTDSVPVTAPTVPPSSGLTPGSGPVTAPTVPPVPGDAPKPKMTQMSLADALTKSHPTLHPQEPSAAASWLASIPRKWLYAGAAVFAVLLIVAVWPHGGDEDEDGGDDGSVAAKDKPDEQGSGGGGKVDDEVLVAIDMALTSKNEDEALDLIRPARDKFPEDPKLLWREGKALSMKRSKSSRVTALERYGEAFDHDPSLIDDPEFYRELYELLNNKSLRDQAIDLAVQKLGSAGHQFLLELVNVDNPRDMLGWVDRHRILDVLGEDIEAVRRVNWKLNLARDLYQVSEAPAPCTEFGRVLDKIAESKDVYYVEHVFSSKLEAPKHDPEKEEAPEACEGLDERLVVVRDLLSSIHPEEAAKHGGGTKKTSKKRKRKKK
jgi:tRNA A-37 threonylcarbamoyl transferase component Bud32